MAAKPSLAHEILTRYAAGYFPLYDIANRFYWERPPIRAIIALTPETLAHAKKLARRPQKKFFIRHTTAVEAVISLLQNPRIKANSWVRTEVVAIYRVLHAAGLLQTVEAWDRKTNQLAGALLGLVLPGTFIAETMFSLQADASKLCLCQLLQDAHAAGHHLIDVQTPHDLEDLSRLGVSLDSADKTPHPCIRLGEQTLPLSLFLRLRKSAAACTFPGTLSDWLAISAALAAGARSPQNASALLASLNSRHLAAALPMLKNNQRQPDSPP